MTTIIKLFARFGDDNEAEALAAFRQFRRYCHNKGIKVVDLTITSRTAQFPIDEYVRLLDKLRTPLHKRISDLEDEVQRKDAEIARLRHGKKGSITKRV